jgi:hypothetical protein
VSIHDDFRERQGKGQHVAIPYVSLWLPSFPPLLLLLLPASSFLVIVIIHHIRVSSHIPTKHTQTHTDPLPKKIMPCLVEGLESLEELNLYLKHTQVDVRAMGAQVALSVTATEVCRGYII